MSPPSPYVLVIEAHPDVRVALQMALEFEFIEVAVASTAREALEVLVWRGRPALLMMDAALPELDRARLVRLLRQEPLLGAVPIVLLAMEDTVRPPDVQAVLRKPFNLESLYAVVEAHLDARPDVLPAVHEAPARLAL